MFDQRLLVVTGKGGVGRSAVSAALALRLAAADRRVLVLAADNGIGLAAHLGVGSLGSDPRQVEPGISAARIVPAEALDDYVRLQLPVNPLRVVSRIFKVLVTVVPGVRDIVVIGKAYYEATLDAWDVVVMDGPPAGQAESLLCAPGVIEGLVPRGLVRRQAAQIRLALSDPVFTGVVTVSTPEELPLAEAASVEETAVRNGLTESRYLIINRLLAAPGFSGPPDDPGPERDAALMHLGVSSSQRAAIAEVAPDAVLPHLFRPESPRALAQALSERIAG